MTRRQILAALALLALLPAAACRSRHVEVSVENRSGADVRLLEVDYPNASFGVDALAAGATYHYRVQVSGEGAVKVQYTDAANHQPQMTGPTLHEDDQGRLDIVLLPAGKADFNPQLVPSR
ncbi:MAG TPA: hypothetical protein VG267_07865 [Terracidiphilus sp.]|jgi:hypothetical protein|nr:hypothetical protein [Terracidiphilus sp.]